LAMLWQAVCKMIREQAQPYIDQYGPKFKLDSIEFESLTLGTLPPTFVGKGSRLNEEVFDLMLYSLWLMKLL
jgi:hypothetical protein